MADPATNTTTPAGTLSQSWGEEPNFRGTFGIILLCFSSMLIFAWNSLHFNIPTTRYSATRRFFLQVCWTFIAFCSPEFLLFLAVNERISANILVEKVLAVHPDLAKPKSVARHNISGLARWILVSAECPYVIE